MPAGENLVLHEGLSSVLYGTGVLIAKRQVSFEEEVADLLLGL
jgi:hypothetical protein